MHVDKVTWSKLTARAGDPPGGQVQSMSHSYKTNLQAGLVYKFSKWENGDSV